MAEHLRESLLERVRLLRSRPDGGYTIGAKIDDGASGAHGGVRLKRPLVRGLNFAGGVRQSSRGVTLFQQIATGLGSGGPHVLKEVGRE